MSTASPVRKPAILFINYNVEQCGVHQYGKNLFEAISKSQKYFFRYAEVGSLEGLDSSVAKLRCDAIIYNYHPQTLAFINPQQPRRYKQVNIAVVHEMTQAEADAMPNKFFQCYVMGDPTLVENNPAVFKTGRLILPYENRKKLPEIPIVGTFGFSVGSKGYQRLIDVVQQEFDEAVVRIHIPSNGIIDLDGDIAFKHIEECQQKIKKPGIKLEASHEFLDRDAMLDFLAGNTINAFLYDYLEVAGISSSPDHAIAVRRPMAITKSIMFRHLHSLSPSITIENSSLRQIIANGIEPFAHLYDLWSEDNLCAEYEAILDKILDPQRASEFKAVRTSHDTKIHFIQDFDYKKLHRQYGSKRNFIRRKVDLAVTARTVNRFFNRGESTNNFVAGVKRFNRILDNQARSQYKSAIESLRKLAPEVLFSKIPAANVQQAFIFDCVRRFTSRIASPRILCVGSYDDSACIALKKIGYVIEEIDPAVNGLDLNTFFHLPSTRKRSYDVVFSTSVIEHVQDDETFASQIAELLAPGGVAVLTCDYNDLFKPGDPIISGNYRFYTQKDLMERLIPSLRNCALIDVPHWECTHPDFMFVGFNYTFATIVFRKNKQVPQK
jgi:SAM-dependent methyltransferase